MTSADSKGNTAGPSFWAIVLVWAFSIIVWIFLDIKVFAFDGIDYRSVFTGSLIWQLLRWLGSSFLVIFLILGPLKYKDRRDYVASSIIILIFWLIINLNWNRGTLVHLVLPVAFYLLYSSSQEDKAGFKYLVCVLLLMDFFGYSLIKGIFNPNPLVFSRLIFPIWPIVIIFFGASVNSKVTFLAFLMFLLIGLMWYDGIGNIRNGKASLLDQRTVNAFYTSIRRAVSNLGLLWTGTTQGISQGVSNSIKYATGYDYYTSTVEDNKEEQLGVYLEDIETTDFTYHYGDSVTVKGFLKARTLGENTITITIDCSAVDVDGKETKATSVFPGGTIVVRDFDEKFVGCNFDDLEVGTYEIKLKIKFNFETMAYVRTYFMSSENLLAKRKELRDNGEDYSKGGVLSAFELQGPYAVYTNGPVAIELGSNEAPICVGPDSGETPYYSVKIRNQWTGTIEEINNVHMLVPAPITLKGTKPSPDNAPICGNDNFLLIASDSAKGEEGYNKYSLQNFRPEKTQQLISEEAEFVCFMNVQNNALENIEVPTPRTLKATVDYIYSVQEDIDVEILEELV